MLTDVIAWLCRSPRRLAMGAVAILAVVLVGGGALFNTNGDRALPARPDASEPTATTPTAQVPNAGPFVAAALNFTRHWALRLPAQTQQQWLKALTPLVTPDLAEALATTDPANLPGVAPQGEPVVRFVTQTSSLIAVPLADGSSVLITVVHGAGGELLVRDVQPNVGDN